MGVVPLPALTPAAGLTPPTGLAPSLAAAPTAATSSGLGAGPPLTLRPAFRTPAPLRAAPSRSARHPTRGARSILLRLQTAPGRWAPAHVLIAVAAGGVRYFATPTLTGVPISTLGRWAPDVTVLFWLVLSESDESSLLDELLKVWKPLFSYY